MSPLTLPSSRAWQAAHSCTGCAPPPAPCARAPTPTQCHSQKRFWSIFWSILWSIQIVWPILPERPLPEATWKFTQALAGERLGSLALNCVSWHETTQVRGIRCNCNATDMRGFGFVPGFPVANFNRSSYSSCMKWCSHSHDNSSQAQCRAGFAASTPSPCISRGASAEFPSASASAQDSELLCFGTQIR